MKKIMYALLVAILLVCQTNVKAANDALWANQISKKEFVQKVQNFKVPKMEGETMPARDGYNKFFRGFPRVFYNIAKRYGLNPMYVFAFAIEESMWGTTQSANAHNDLWRIADSEYNPQRLLMGFISPKDCIRCMCEILKVYATPGTWQYECIKEEGYNPKSIKGQMYLFCYEPQRAKKIKRIMKLIFR